MKPCAQQVGNQKIRPVARARNGSPSPVFITIIHCGCSTVALFAAGTPATAAKQQQKEEGEETKDVKEEEEEEIYAPLGESDECDTILKSFKAPAIANHPPVPTPRPQSAARGSRQNPLHRQKVP